MELHEYIFTHDYLPKIQLGIWQAAGIFPNISPSYTGNFTHDQVDFSCQNSTCVGLIVYYSIINPLWLSVISYCVLVTCFCPCFHKIMAEDSENHWLSQEARFGHLSSKSWTSNASAKCCVKIKPSWAGHLKIYFKLSVSSKLWENNICVHNAMSQSCVPSMWCTLYMLWKHTL